MYLADHLLRDRKRIGLGRRFIPPNPMDSRKPHRQAGFMAAGGMNRVKLDFQH